MKSIKILTASHKDVRSFSNIAPGVFDDPINHEALVTFLRDPNHFIVIAIDEARDGQIVGKVTGMRLLHPDKSSFEFFINEVDVSPLYRCRDIGTALMTAIFKCAKEANCRLAWLAVNEDNDTALAFYAAVGGEQPERQIHIDFGLSNV